MSNHETDSGLMSGLLLVLCRLACSSGREVQCIYWCRGTWDTREASGVPARGALTASPPELSKEVQVIDREDGEV